MIQAFSGGKSPLIVSCATNRSDSARSSFLNQSLRPAKARNPNRSFRSIKAVAEFLNSENARDAKLNAIAATRHMPCHGEVDGKNVADALVAKMMPALGTDDRSLCAAVLLPPRISLISGWVAIPLAKMLNPLHRKAVLGLLTHGENIQLVVATTPPEQALEILRSKVARQRLTKMSLRDLQKKAASLNE